MGLILPTESNLATTQKQLAKLAGRLLALLSPHRESLTEFAGRLVAAFRSGLAVNHPTAGTWYSTLEVIAPEDNQVAARVRVSLSTPTGVCDPKQGSIDLEERDRPLFAEPIPAAPSNDDDLLLRYSFPMVFSVERNLKLFQKFASNELGRLRPHASSELNASDEVKDAAQQAVPRIRTFTLRVSGIVTGPQDSAEHLKDVAKNETKPGEHEA